MHKTIFTGKLCVTSGYQTIECRTRQLIQVRKLLLQLKNRERYKSVPPQKICRVQYVITIQLLLS